MSVQHDEPEAGEGRTGGDRFSAVAPLDREPASLRPAVHPARTLGVAVVVAAALVLLGRWLAQDPVDLPALIVLNRLHSDVIGRIASTVYLALEPVPAVLLTVLTTGVVWASRRSLRAAAAFAGVVAGTWIPSAVVKILTGRHRPDPAVLSHPFTPVQLDASFPSGHTVFVAVFVIALAWTVPRAWVVPTVALGTLVTAVVAGALMIDAVHFPLDVAASVCWALAVAPAVRHLWVDWLMPHLPGLSPRAT